VIIFSGCGQKQIQYVDRPVLVNVPVKCSPPKVVCEFVGSDEAVLGQLLGCNYNLREALKVCE